MTHKLLAASLIVALELSVSASSLLAQSTSVFNRQVTQTGDPRPRSLPGGYAGTEMRNIYSQDVGRGFTSQSLNAISLEYAKSHVQNVGQSSFGQPSSNGDLGLGPSQRLGKPFANVSQAPTTSPYLNLFREGIGEANDFDYQTLVRPQVQQQQMNQQFQRQQLELARRVQKISAQSDYKNPAGAEDEYPTGHKTVFGQYGHFFPSINQTVRKRGAPPTGQ